MKSGSNPYNWQHHEPAVEITRALEVIQGSILDLEGTVEPRNRPEDFDAIRRTVRRQRAARVAGG